MKKQQIDLFCGMFLKQREADPLFSELKRLESQIKWSICDSFQNVQVFTDLPTTSLKSSPFDLIQVEIKRHKFKPLPMVTRNWSPVVLVIMALRYELGLDAYERLLLLVALVANCVH
jgi:hypothetical protein